MLGQKGSSHIYRLYKMEKAANMLKGGTSIQKDPN